MRQFTDRHFLKTNSEKQKYFLLDEVSGWSHCELSEAAADRKGQKQGDVTNPFVASMASKPEHQPALHQTGTMETLNFSLSSFSSHFQIGFKYP